MINYFMSRRAMPVTLNKADSRELKLWVSAHHTPQQVAKRCRIILAAANGEQDKDIADAMQINYKTVALWRCYFWHYPNPKRALLFRMG